VVPTATPVSLKRQSLSDGDDDTFRQEILTKFIEDDVGRICKTDAIILLVGRWLFAGSEHKKDKVVEVSKSVSKNMRRLGHLFVYFRSELAPQDVAPTSADMLDHRNFPALKGAPRPTARKTKRRLTSRRG
jgi:hypothetical protein